MSDRAKNVAKLVEEGVPRSVASKAVSLAKGHHHIQERWCNEEMTDATTKEVEETERDTEAEIARILAPYGITITFSGDPRGYTTKLHLPSKDWNTWGGEEEGWGI